MNDLRERVAQAIAAVHGVADESDTWMRSIRDAQADAAIRIVLEAAAGVCEDATDPERPSTAYDMAYADG